eukprot:363958-Amphidinium_carterae.1
MTSNSSMFSMKGSRKTSKLSYFTARRATEARYDVSQTRRTKNHATNDRTVCQEAPSISRAERKATK